MFRDFAWPWDWVELLWSEGWMCRMRKKGCGMWRWKLISLRRCTIWERGRREGNNGSCSLHGVVNSPRERRWGPGWGALRWPEFGGGRFRIRGGQRERSGVGFRVGGCSAGGGILAAGRRDVPGWK